MGRIVTPNPPSALIDAARLNLTQDWATIYAVPFFSNSLGAGAQGQASADTTAVFTFASGIASSLLVANSSPTTAVFSARVFSGRMSVRSVTLTAQAGTNRLEFKGYGPEDNLGSALDNVRLLSGSGSDAIVNGSFEDVTGLTKTSYGYVGIGAIPGWTDYVATTRLDVHQDTRFGVVPSDRASWLDTRGSAFADPNHPNNGNIHVYQDIPGLGAGTTHTLFFDYADDEDRGNRVEVIWNGAVQTVEGQTLINPVVERMIAQSVSVPPGDFVRLPIEKSMAVSSDIIQLKAEGDYSLSAHLSITVKTAAAFTIL
jgi:hypothetical protein